MSDDKREELLGELSVGLPPYGEETPLDIIDRYGYVLAPKEPTEEITDAIYEAETGSATTPEVYAAIIAAIEAKP